VAEPVSNSKELLTLEVGADTKKALLEVTRFQRHVSTKMKKVQESTQKVDKGFTRFMKQVQGARTKSKGIKDLAAQFKALDKVVNDRASLVSDAIRNARKSKRGSQERKDLMARIKDVKKSSGYGQAFSARRGAQQGQKSLKDTSGFDWKDMREGAEEAGESLSEPLRDLLSKDAPTLMRRAMRTLMSSHGAALKVRDFGADLSQRGSKMMAGGGLAGKVGGGAAKAGGELTKMFGSLAGVITKIGPILSVAGSFMMSFVKIMIDAESAAKDFNKQILATTSTSGYLRRNFGSVSNATAALDDSLRAARDGAMDFSMVQWGISKETAAAFQSAITAEGVALDRLGNATASATENAEAHSRSIQVGVAYSRAFGVSLSEIAQLQGSLMADLGMGAKGVQASFQTIADGADQAGMETNKFFGIVRSFSSDLSLFTLRLAEISKVMGVLGKTMDPRKMGQFLQALNGKFRGGVLDNLKFSMLAGPKSRDIVKDDAADKLTNLTSDLKEALGEGSENAISELLNVMKGDRDPLKIAQWQAKYLADAMNKGPLSDSIQDNINVQNKLASGDKIDQAALMDGLAPLRKLQTLEEMSVQRFGRSLDKLGGISLAAMEEVSGMKTDEIEMFKRLKQGIMQGQAELIQRVTTGKQTPSDLAQLSKLKVSKTGAEGAKELEGIFRSANGLDAYMKSLDKSQRELLDDSSKQIDYQSNTASFQTSVMDRIGIIADILLNRIYGVMTDIWGSIIEIIGLMKFGRDKGAEFGRAQLAANKSKDAQLAQVFSDANGNLTKAKTDAIEKVGARAQDNVKKALSEYGALKDRLATGKDDAATKANIQNRMTELSPALKMQDQADVSSKAFKDHLYRVGASQDLGGVPAVISELSNMLKVGGGSGATVAPAQSAPTAMQQVDTTKSVEQLHRTIANDGVKLDPSSVSGPLADAMSKSVYEGSAKALFEYYMYSALDRSTVSTALGAGVSPSAIAQSMNSGLGPQTAMTQLMSSANAGAPNARGGTVTGIMGNMANVARFPPAPAGEGWASVGRGEKIMPAGGSGGGSVKVELELKGDLKRFIQARVVEGAAAHDRNKRLR
jgi:hypothetical protein